MTPPAYERIGSVTKPVWRCRCYRCPRDGEPARVFEYWGDGPPMRCPKCKSTYWHLPRKPPGHRRGRPPGS